MFKSYSHHGETV